MNGLNCYDHRINRDVSTSEMLKVNLNQFKVGCNSNSATLQRNETFYKKSVASVCQNAAIEGTFPIQFYGFFSNIKYKCEIIIIIKPVVNNSRLKELLLL